MCEAKRWVVTGMAAAALLWSAGALAAEGKKADKKLLEGAQTLHAANEGEVQMGQMGVQMATDPQVKQFAQRMVDDHSRNDQHLATLAQTMGIPLTGKAYQEKQKEGQKSMSKVHGKTGADFDKEYMSLMVKDHEKDAKEVKSLAGRAHKEGQAEMASFLDTTEQAMQQHLSTAKQLEQELKRGTASAAGGTSASGMGTGSAGTSGANP